MVGSIETEEKELDNGDLAGEPVDMRTYKILGIQPWRNEG